MRKLVERLLAVGCLTSTISAVTLVSDADMMQMLNEGGVGLAMKAQPMFFFAQAIDQPSCIPTFAVVDGKQVPPSMLCAWPDTGCDCRTPGVDIGNPTPPFPIYYSYSKCSDGAVRVAYNLFYTKDGFKPNKTFGHPYDWERVIVVWKQAEGQWRPDELLLSQHTAYGRLKWQDIQNTFDDQDAGQPFGGNDGRTNLDHPKVYVEWSKHANRDNRNALFTGVLAQLTDLAYRSNDWWYYPQRNDYIRADRSTDIGRLLGSFDWGEASSNPASVHEGLCKA